MAKLTEKALTVLNFIKNNDSGNGVTIDEIAAGTGFTKKQVGPLVWTTLKEKTEKGTDKVIRGKLVEYNKESKKAFITALGATYEEAEEEVAE